MVDEFVQRGHQVSGCCRSESAVSDLREEFGDSHHFQVVDVKCRDSVGQWCRETIAKMGAPDLLVNNAALINKNARLWEVPAAEFAEVIEVNIVGVYHVLAEFVPLMVAAGEGVIVNFSSTWGRSTSPEVAPYCATKYAVEGLTKALASELPAGLCAVPFNPGVIHTDMLRSCFGAQAASFPDPSDWAQTAVPKLLALSASDNGISQ